MQHAVRHVRSGAEPLCGTQSPSASTSQVGFDGLVSLLLLLGERPSMWC